MQQEKSLQRHFPWSETMVIFFQSILRYFMYIIVTGLIILAVVLTLGFIAEALPAFTHIIFKAIAVSLTAILILTSWTCLSCDIDAKVLRKPPIPLMENINYARRRLIHLLPMAVVNLSLILAISWLTTFPIILLEPILWLSLYHVMLSQDNIVRSYTRTLYCLIGSWIKAAVNIFMIEFCVYVMLFLFIIRVTGLEKHAVFATDISSSLIALAIVLSILYIQVISIRLYRVMTKKLEQ